MLTQYDKPCIQILRAPDAPAAGLQALCSGIEEEMIPYAVREAPGREAAAMAFAAAEASRLDVGLALTAQAAALHYTKLAPDRPLFLLQGRECGAEDLRRLGANAARLVKGIAFKE